MLFYNRTAFQSTPPVRRATSWRRRCACSWVRTFQSTPPVRRATEDAGSVKTIAIAKVSIHAPRAEGDSSPRRSTGRTAGGSFNPRPPCGGRRGRRAVDQDIGRKFQSTPPVRRATQSAPEAPPRPNRFNPRPPCGGRQDRVPAVEASDAAFQSTPPVRRATRARGQRRQQRRVSIHAPRAEGDPTSTCRSRGGRRFNPRPPCGGRLFRGRMSDYYGVFQSTPPVRRATSRSQRRHLPHKQFQSTPPVRRATRHHPESGGADSPGFNPRPPCGGRPRAYPSPGRPGLIVSIHAPRAEGDITVAVAPARALPFQSTPPVRRATILFRDPQNVATRKVSIHAPRAEGDS